MKPVIALVGRPNVGKSTLFNRLTRTRDALVADMPGLTRDRRYGDGRVGDFDYLVVDTGGLLDTDNIFGDMISRQTWLAIEEADMVMFLVDGRSGATAVDTELAQQLRRLKKPLMLVVNKIDGVGEDQAAIEFYSYGLGEPQTIAAAHNRGVSQMMENAAAALGITPSPAPEEDPLARPKRIRIAVIGRPNAGKSTLVNRL
ncbi:MAG: GTPase, partial [Granulosicoccaceae bacterium]